MHNSLNNHPNSMKSISEWSAGKDLLKHMHKIKKGNGRILTSWRTEQWNSGSKALQMSKSTPELLLWSFMHQETTESPQTQINFRTPFSHSCACMAGNLAQMNSPDDDSCSVLHRGHEYAKRMKVCVKKFGFSKRENFEEIWKFSDLSVVLSQWN